jgi:hypothetical protein
MVDNRQVQARYLKTAGRVNSYQGGNTRNAGMGRPPLPHMGETTLRPPLHETSFSE